MFVPQHCPYPVHSASGNTYCYCNVIILLFKILSTMNLTSWMSVDKAAMWHHCGFLLITSCSSDNEHLKATFLPLAHVHILEIDVSKKNEGFFNHVMSVCSKLFKWTATNASVMNRETKQPSTTTRTNRPQTQMEMAQSSHAQGRICR